MKRIKSVDQVAFYQLKTMMQGVLARGTARAIADFSPSVAGKTGDVGRRERRLVRRLFQRRDRRGVDRLRQRRKQAPHAGRRRDRRRRRGADLRAGDARVWNDVTPRTALAPPSPEAQQYLSCTSIDKSTSECLRTDNKGGVIDTTTALESGSDGRGRYAKRGNERPQDAPKHKVAHRYSGERAAVAPPATTPQWGWGGGNGWYGAAAPSSTTTGGPIAGSRFAGRSRERPARSTSLH
jgi:hypothetical protein